MNLFSTIKAAVTTRQAAEHFGLAVDKYGMALCPFHDDHQPSLKLDQRYYCFGCHATGDVIDFTAKFFGISGHGAASSLIRGPPNLRGDANREILVESVLLFYEKVIVETEN